MKVKVSQDSLIISKCRRIIKKKIEGSVTRTFILSPTTKPTLSSGKNLHFIFKNDATFRTDTWSFFVNIASKCCFIIRARLV